MNSKSSIVNSKLRGGFSLAEVLIAIAILTIALVMVGASFPVGVAMTANVAERTIAAVVADQAFAMMKLYGISTGAAAWNTPLILISPAPSETIRQNWLPFESVVASPLPADPCEVFAYPCDKGLIEKSESVYYWSALCKRELDAAGIPTGDVRVVVFVSRKVGLENTKYPVYYGPTDIAVAPPISLNDWPRPILLFTDRNANRVFDAGDACTYTQDPSLGRRSVQIAMFPPPVQRIYLNAGAFVLEDAMGEVYRITDRADVAPPAVTMATITLDRDLVRKPVAPDKNYRFWVVPPGIGTSRNPCIAVYQKVIKF